MNHKLNAKVKVCEGVATWEFTCEEPANAPCRRHCNGADEDGVCRHLMTDCEWVNDDYCKVVEWLDADESASAEGQHIEFVAWEGKVQTRWAGEWFDFEPILETPTVASTKESE